MRRQTVEAIVRWQNALDDGDALEITFHGGEPLVPGAEFYRMAEETDARPPVSQPALEDCGGWMVTAIYFTLGMSYDLRGPLREVDVPVLVLHGDRDLVRPEVSRGYADVFPKARFEMITGAGHMVFNDRPDQFADAVRSFLRSLEDK